MSDTLIQPQNDAPPATSKQAPGESAYEWFTRRVRETLIYDPKEGKLYWRERRCPRRTAGHYAGKVHHGHRFVYLEGNLYSARRLCWLLAHGDWEPKVMYHRDPLDLRLSNLYVPERY
jgi:hypothetical protein